MLVYFAVALISFVVYVKWRHSYWKRRGVTQLDPDFFIGDSNMVRGKYSLAELCSQRYNTFKSRNEQFGGAYIFLQPIFYAIDPALIKHIMQIDFSYFMNHGLFHHPKDILSMNLFNLEGEVWKNLRAKLTPTFTSGKMKMMFETLVEKTVGLEKLVDEFASKQEPIGIKDVLGRFTTDIIGSCAFGIECNSLEDPENVFRVYGRKVFKLSIFKYLAISALPWDLLGNLGFKAEGSEVSNFFTKIVKETIETREVNHIVRKDFMHLLLQLKNQNLNSVDEKTNRGGGSNIPCTLSEDEIIAQCYIFFLAGFDTSSTTMTFALLELAQNPDIQSKLREEINLVLKKYNGQVTYDAVMEMSYLDKVVNETLRKFPAAPVIPRVCTKNYKVPGSNVVIEKGCRVNIPVWGLHRDPEYYPDPERFDPERFTEENKAKRPDFTYLPFGEGPRMCIGIRFGLLQTKVGLISLIKNFSFSLNKKTPIPAKISKGAIIISVEGELWLDATKV